MIKKLIFASLLLVTAGYSFVAAADSTPSPIPVGMLLPLSGNYAAIGVDNRQGFETALEELGASSLINLIYADSKADPTTAVSEFRRLVDVKNVFAIFAFRGPVGMAVSPLSKTAHVPLLGGVGNKEFTFGNDYSIQLWSRSDDEGGFLAEQLIARGLKRLGMVTAQDDWPNAVSVGFREQFKKLGGEILSDQEFAPSESDFRTSVSQIKSAAPQAVFVNLALPQIGVFLRQAREQNITTPLFSNFWAAKKDVIAAAGTAAEGVQFVEMDTNLPRFKEKIKATFSSTPSAATLSSYVAAHLLVQAAKENPPAKSREEFFAAILKQTEIKTPERTYPVISRCVKFPLVLRTIKDGQAQ